MGGGYRRRRTDGAAHTLADGALDARAECRTKKSPPALPVPEFAGAMAGARDDEEIEISIGFDEGVRRPASSTPDRRSRSSSPTTSISLPVRRCACVTFDCSA